MSEGKKITRPRKYTWMVTGFEVDADEMQAARLQEAMRTLARMLVQMQVEEAGVQRGKSE